MNIVIFGPPGAGKGTQSKFIVNKFNLYQLSTGDLLRNEINNKTKLGSEISSIINSGELVSDKIVNNLIEKFVSNDIYKNKIIFDGYPRTLTQAENLDDLLKRYNQKIDIVLKLSVSLDTVKKRIFERQNQENRADDNEEVAIKRYKTYEKSSAPVINYYKQSNLLKVVNGEAGISEISIEISGLINAIKGWLWGIWTYKYKLKNLSMARIAGVNIPQDKIVHIALTYIHGIGDHNSKLICEKLNIPLNKRVNNLSEDEVLKIREYIDKNYTVEGDLRREVSMNIKRLVDLASYRGSRHKKNYL